MNLKKLTDSFFRKQIKPVGSASTDPSEYESDAVGIEWGLGDLREIYNGGGIDLADDYKEGKNMIPDLGLLIWDNWIDAMAGTRFEKGEPINTPEYNQVLEELRLAGYPLDDDNPPLYGFIFNEQDFWSGHDQKIYTDKTSEPTTDIEQIATALKLRKD